MGGLNIDIQAAGNALLGAVTASLIAADVQIPKRTGFVPGGLVAYDGEMLVCNLVNIGMGQPGQDQATSVQPVELMFYYWFQINFLRQVPGIAGDGMNGGLLPTNRAQENSYALLANDAENLLGAVVAAQASGAIVPINIPFHYGPLAMVGPEGTLGGSRIDVKFQAGHAMDGSF